MLLLLVLVSDAQLISMLLNTEYTDICVNEMKTRGATPSEEYFE